MEKIYDAEFQSAESYIENLLSELNGRIDEIVLEMSRDWALVERGCLIENEIQELEVKTAELEREKERLLDIGKSLKTALDVLEEAALEIKREFAPLLNQKLGSIAGFDKSVGAGYPAHCGGTVEQLYLALRIALAETGRRSFTPHYGRGVCAL